MRDGNELVERLALIAGPANVVSDPGALATYRSDGLLHYRQNPSRVLPAPPTRCADRPRLLRGGRSVGRARRGHRAVRRRPAGRGRRSDRARRMRRILEVDLEDSRVVVEPGVTNLAISRAVAPDALLPARSLEPDRVLDRRQRRGELRRRALLQVRLHDQLRHRAGGRAERRRRVVELDLERPGYDLLGAFVGSEGTLGVATRITLRVVPAPEAVRTLVAFFEATGAAGEAVSAIVAAGIVPGRDRDDGPALDRGRRAGDRRRLPARRRRGAARRARRPARGVRRRASSSVMALCAQAGATRVRVALTSAERELIWKTRKAAFAAMGRIAPAYFVQDGVIPRTRLPEVLAPDRRARRRVRPAGRERLPRRRRQPASAGLLRRGARRARPSAPRSSPG